MPNRHTQGEGEKSLVAPPSPAEIRATRAAAGLSQNAAAKLLYKTGRVWQYWEAGERRMDPAFWELFRIKLAASNARS